MANKRYLIRRIKYKFGAYQKRRANTELIRYIIKILIILFTVAFVMFTAGKRISTFALKIGESSLENQIRYDLNTISAEKIYEYNDRVKKILTANYDENNKNRLISVDFTELNMLKAELTNLLTEYLSEHSEIICHVPVGVLMSNDVFASYGVKIPIKITSSGYVRVDFDDDFTSGGINQTKHRIMLKVTACVSLHTIYEEAEHEIKLDIPVTEIINIGEVPSFMMNPSE